MAHKPSDVLRALRPELPPAPPPAGLYKPVIVSGGMLYVSGQGPMLQDGTYRTGRAGADLDLAAAKAAARQVGLTMLATLDAHFGDLDRIECLVKTLGMVNCTPDFMDHPLVINGFSELMAEVFGPDKGVGARSAVGMMLPGQVAVEIEAIFQLK
ncbi:RidA family protein [Robiginitalea sp. M366]|uniref:RidA family protein n=1 Tax=Robiginitalea aestuariiviva TaxID=3036903 RepID=UPI00240D38E3|nr:RidA family protein [Robiginitalea aestuariiviva]MDG1571798.1 RidA family protein [Robiginitalea aestuariiviva]